MLYDFKVCVSLLTYYAAAVETKLVLKVRQRTCNEKKKKDGMHVKIKRIENYI